MHMLLYVVGVVLISGEDISKSLKVHTKHQQILRG